MAAHTQTRSFSMPRNIILVQLMATCVSSLPVRIVTSAAPTHDAIIKIHSTAVRRLEEKTPSPVGFEIMMGWG